MVRKRLSENLREEIFSFKASKLNILWLKELWKKLQGKGYDVDKILQILDLEEEFRFWSKVINKSKEVRKKDA